jgi:chain length determinant protein tyrosine kinase EpsG
MNRAPRLAAVDLHTGDLARSGDSGPETLFDLPAPGPLLGELLAEQRVLDRAGIDTVLARQRQAGGRFGETAVALGLASAPQVQQALARQFNYLHHPAPQGDAARLSPELVMLHEPFGTRAEMVRTLRSQLTLRLDAIDAAGAPRRALAVLSPGRGDGRSWGAANLAVALAQLGGRTLLVDADLRHGRQAELFGLDAAAGLSSVLAGRADATAVQAVPVVPGLSVLPAGPLPPNPLELVERPLFGALVQRLAQRYTHVVVDTPAAAAGADATVVAARCGAALMLARRDVARVDALQALAQAVAATSTVLLGVVYNAH